MADEKSHYQAVWRKAQREGKGFDLPCPTPSDAVRTRLALYRAVKEVREGKSIDQELTLAMQNVSLRVTKEQPCVVQVRHINQSAILQAIRDVVGTELVEQKEGHDELAESQKRMLARLQSGELTKEVHIQPSLPVSQEHADSEKPQMPAPGTRVTPYYTR